MRACLSLSHNIVYSRTHACAACASTRASRIHWTLSQSEFLSPSACHYPIGQFGIVCCMHSPLLLLLGRSMMINLRRVSYVVRSLSAWKRTRDIGVYIHTMRCVQCMHICIYTHEWNIRFFALQQCRDDWQTRGNLRRKSTAAAARLISLLLWIQTLIR